MCCKWIDFYILIFYTTFILCFFPSLFDVFLSCESKVNKLSYVMS